MDSGKKLGLIIIIILFLIITLEIFKPLLMLVFPIMAHINIMCIWALIPTFALSFYNKKLDRATGSGGQIIEDKWIFLALGIVLVGDIVAAYFFYNILFIQFISIYMGLAIIPFIGGVISILVAILITIILIGVWICCFSFRLGKRYFKFIFHVK